MLQGILFVKLASHLIKKKLPYFGTCFLERDSNDTLIQNNIMTSTNSSPWGFTHLCGNIPEITIQLILKKKISINALAQN